MDVEKKIADLENKVAFLLERVLDLALVIKEYNDEFRVGLANVIIVTRRGMKGAAALEGPI